MSIQDVTEELNTNGFLGYTDMDDVLSSAATTGADRLNSYKLR
ncbi:hypothetical protein [Streptomyces triticirhizae]|nr:hypothetical protein [Streptomyces triticirhizae]